MHSAELVVVGSQWYWVYAVDAASLYCYSVRECDLQCGDLRLLQGSQLAVVDAVLVMARACIAQYACCALRVAMRLSRHMDSILCA